MIVGNDAAGGAREVGIWDNLTVANNLWAGGKVGIGTIAPGSFKLAVAGKIGAWGEVHVYNVDTYFPDYVFEKGYRLRPLAEVARYIAKNKHLPEIPSAKTVAAEGMGLAEMNVIAIKKIEELTLYLLEQDQQLRELKKQNEALLERVRKLEN